MILSYNANLGRMEFSEGTDPSEIMQPSPIEALVQKRQIGTQNFAGVCIQREKPVNDPVIELILVCGHDNDVNLPCRNFRDATCFSVSVSYEPNFLDVLCYFNPHSPVWIALQDINCVGACLPFREQSGGMNAA